MSDETDQSGEYRLRSLEEILAPYSDPETWRWQIEELDNPELKALFSKRLESLDASKESLEGPIKHMLAPISYEESLAANGEDGPLTKHLPAPSIRQIISGGQTGADRAALDWAIETDIRHSGWCPKGRLAEDGVIPARYNLSETDETEHSVRTWRNVQESDGTVIITLARELTGGSRETAEHATEAGKRHIHLSSAVHYDVAATLRAFVRINGLEVVNIAGSRESEEPGIYEFTKSVLIKAFPQDK